MGCGGHEKGEGKGRHKWTRLKTAPRQSTSPCSLDDSAKLRIRRLDPCSRDFEVLAIVGGDETAKVGTVMQTVGVDGWPVIAVGDGGFDWGFKLWGYFSRS